VVRGNLLVIPIEDALIYVEAIYLQAESAQLPELKRVIVSYEKQIAMERTLEEALRKVFGGALPAPVSQALAAGAETAVVAPGAAAQWPELARSATATYAEAVEAQKAGDWAAYGAALKRLEGTLQALDAAAGTTAAE
jgi:hypothetical protein